MLQHQSIKRRKPLVNNDTGAGQVWAATLKGSDGEISGDLQSDLE